MAKGGKFLDFLASIAPHLLGFGSNIMTNLFNKKFADEANKTNLEIARQTNEANMQMTNATNLANRELVREQNAAAAAEAEKAYQRSKPTTQVANMQAAGMSLAGAINSLNGGGSYSPAPVNVSSDEASRNQSAQVSPAQLMSAEGVFANLANSFMQREQIKSSERMHKEQINLDRDRLQWEKDKWNEDAPLRAATLTKLGLENDLLELEKDVSNAIKDGRINAEQAENLSRQSQAILDDFRSKRVFEAMARMSDEDLDKLFELQATLNMLQQGLQYDSTATALRALKKLGSFVSKGVAGGAEIGRHIRTH